MPKTLVVPDIHERIDVLMRLEVEEFPKADRVVFLGDWFDTFHARVPQAICQWLLEHLGDHKFTFLLGNHDCHYAFDHDMFKCSGYDEGTKRVVRAHMQPDNWRRFQLSTYVGPYLVSHAGFHHRYMGYIDALNARDAIEIGLNGGFEPVFTPGYAVGGKRGDIGGPTWLRWNEEFEPTHGVPQIVGHTYGHDWRTIIGADETVNYCIDTGLKHVLWCEEDAVNGVYVHVEPVAQ